MNHSLTQTSSQNFSRKVKDQVAKYGVTAGGIMVLIALLLIFFYLLYVVQPIFDDVSVTHDQEIRLKDTHSSLALGTDDHVEIGYRVVSNANVEFYGLEGKHKGELIEQHQVVSEPITAFSASMAYLQEFAFATGSQVTVFKPGFKVSFATNKRVVLPNLTYPLGEEGIDLEVDSNITKFAFSVLPENEGAGFLYQLESGDLEYAFMSAEVNFMTDEIEWSIEKVSLPFVNGKVKNIKVTADLSRAFVVQDNTLITLNIRDIEDVTLLSKTKVSEPNANVVDVTLLAGANSILFANDNGVVSQWFEVNDEEGRHFKRIRAFESNEIGLNGVYPEFYRRSFFTTANDGSLGVYHTTSGAKLFHESIADSKIDLFSISPRANAFLTQNTHSINLYKISNEHPEVTWSGLWNEIWYEGYSEPDYVWQSTSASDDFEGKFSLVPITFGTIKAAFYAMLFSVPIALAAAVYTAYFMPSKIRKVVKPTVEIMEALPTVILGFLAGLWLAPLIELHLASIVLLVTILPVAVILFAFMWHNLPKKILNSLPQGMDSLLLIPVILLFGWLCFGMSPWLNDVLFDGDVRLFITDELGISFDQRNSLVVGIAMGFAVIPTIFSIAEDAVFSVPKHLSQGSLALGASQWQTLVRVVLLTASPGIFSAVMMGLGRAVGETMIVLMATGNTPIMDWSVFQGMRTLSANIAVEMPESEVGSTHYRILFLAAFVLFVFTFVFNTIAEFVRQRLREKYSSL